MAADHILLRVRTSSQAGMPVRSDGSKAQQAPRSGWRNTRVVSSARRLNDLESDYHRAERQITLSWRVTARAGDGA